MAGSYSESLPRHGVPMLIPEIVTQGTDMNGKSVRVVGRVDHYDTVNCIASVSEPNKSDVSLPVDTRLTDEGDYRLNSQVMLIGELDKCDNQIILRARVSRCVDRLDYSLYCKTLQVWRHLDPTHT